MYCGFSFRKPEEHVSVYTEVFWREAEAEITIKGLWFEGQALRIPAEYGRSFDYASTSFVRVKRARLISKGPLLISGFIYSKPDDLLSPTKLSHYKIVV